MEQLLKILEDNARLPIEDIATMLNKSPAEVAAMIDLARAQGIIKGYKTLVDWEKAGINRVEAVIELNVSPKRLSPLDDVLSTATHFVLRTYKKEGRLYQDEEIDERECTVL